MSMGKSIFPQKGKINFPHFSKKFPRKRGLYLPTFLFCASDKYIWFSIFLAEREANQIYSIEYWIFVAKRPQSNITAKGGVIKIAFAQKRKGCLKIWEASEESETDNAASISLPLGRVSSDIRFLSVEEAVSYIQFSIKYRKSNITAKGGYLERSSKIKLFQAFFKPISKRENNQFILNFQFF